MLRKVCKMRSKQDELTVVVCETHGLIVMQDVNFWIVHDVSSMRTLCLEVVEADANNSTGRPNPGRWLSITSQYQPDIAVALTSTSYIAITCKYIYVF